MIRWLRWIGLGLGAWLAVSGIYGHVQSMKDTAPYELIEVEPGRHLHVLCEGPRSGPWAIYDAGAFGIYADGWWIKEALKDDIRVCLYDRAGMGWSDPLPTGVAPSALWHVEDIRRLAKALGATKPYYLIGHSMAGLRLHVHANAYRDELAGLVFIDAARPQSFDLESAPPRWLQLAGPVMQVGVIAARIGLARAISPLLSDPLDLPAQQARDKRRALSLAHHYSAARAEILAVGEDRERYQATEAEHLPVAVFAASASGGGNAITARNAERYTGFGRLTPLPDETHVSLLNAENAKKVADDIRAMVHHRATSQLTKRVP